VREYVVAIDIGGTKLAAGTVDDTGCIKASAIGPTPRTTDPEELFSALERHLDNLDFDDLDGKPIAVGVGCGGPMTRGGETVSPLNIPAWRAFPLRARLATVLGLPVYVDNDAKALALGEGWCGAARGVENYIGMVVSTGIGGGIVCDGRLLDGDDGNAGHIGHVIVEPRGHPCGCGARGCVEAEASGTAIARITGGDPRDATPDIIDHAGMLVGRAVASVANLLDLHLAVVSGSVALGYGEPFFAAAQAEIDLRCRLDFSRGTRIVPSALGPDGPLIGAAQVAWSSLRARPGG
jgi:glucokinase